MQTVFDFLGAHPRCVIINYGGGGVRQNTTVVADHF